MDTLCEMLCTYDSSERSKLTVPFMSALLKELRKSKVCWYFVYNTVKVDYVAYGSRSGDLILFWLEAYYY